MTFFILLALVALTSAQAGQWKTYVDSNLLNGGYVSKGAICGFDGSVWGKSDNFALTAEEAVAAGKAFDHKVEVQTKGLTLEGQNYQLIYASEGVMRLRKQAQQISIQKTNQAVIISMCNIEHDWVKCGETTATLAEFMQSVNF